MTDSQLVLYVDDDPDIREVVQTSLCLMSGFEVRTASSGETAIDLAFEWRPDLVLMDVMMPGLDGPSTVVRMRQSPLIAHIPVIFLTAKVMPAEVDRLYGFGAIGVIAKPFDPVTLGERVCAIWAGAGSALRSDLAVAERECPPSGSRDLTGSFLRRATGDAKRLRGMIQRAGEGDRWVLREIEHVAHSIHGTAAMFGFPALSASGGAIERLVGGAAAGVDTRAGMGETQRLVLQQLLECTERLAQELELAARTVPCATAMFQERH